MSKTVRDEIINSIRKETEKVEEARKELYWNQLKASIENPSRITFETLWNNLKDEVM